MGERVKGTASQECYLHEVCPPTEHFEQLISLPLAVVRQGPYIVPPAVKRTTQALGPMYFLPTHFLLPV